MALHLPMVLVAIQLTAAPEIPSKTLRAAQARAEHIFASAGVRLVWTDGAGLRIRVVNCEPRGLTNDAAGFAVLITGESGYAAVAWPSVERAAAQMEVDADVLLGATMAHELGHLLFGPSHTHSGVMSPRLGRKEMELAARGELRFEPGEVGLAASVARLASASRGR